MLRSTLRGIILDWISGLDGEAPQDPDAEGLLDLIMEQLEEQNDAQAA